MNTISDGRRRDRAEKEYYPSGAVRSFYPAEPLLVETSVGTFRAELCTYYEDGSLCRLFPLFGQISGFWTEEDEYSLAEETSVNLPGGPLTCKVLSLFFYPSGQIKSLTVWPQSMATISTPAGMIRTMHGASFYESGELESVEPLIGTRIETPYGAMTLFDPDTFPLNADRNSLKFTKDGKLLEWAGIHDRVSVETPETGRKVFLPEQETDPLDEKVRIIHPLRLRTEDGRLFIRCRKASEAFSLALCRVRIEPAGA